MPGFSPPTWEMHFFEGNRLWRRCHITVGHTIIKFGTSYQQIDNPTTLQMETADALYEGGRTYPISSDEAAALTAAGYGQWVTP